MNHWLPVIVRGALGLILSWAGVIKLSAPRQFFLSLLDYRLHLPDTALRLAAVTLPWLELFCGLLLILNRWRTVSLYVAAVLAVVFAAATGQAWLRGLAISCGCFGSNEAGVWASPALAFIRAVVMLAVAIWLISRQTNSGNTES